MFTPVVGAVFLTVFGLFNLFGIRNALIANQITFLLISAVIFFAVKRTGWRFFKNNAPLLYWIFVALLIVTFFVGIEVKGSRRWIDLYFFNFQPSEFLKVFFIVYLAGILSRAKKSFDDARIFLKTLLYLIIPSAIIFFQPDLGNAMVYGAIYVIMILFSPLPRRYLISLLLFIVLIMPFGYLSLKDYQKTRLTSFFDRTVDIQGASYNRFQAIIATGSGQILGRGLASGTQSRLSYLPENHTDFAFSSLVEQFGFVGGVMVMSLFLISALGLIKKALFFMGRNGEEEYYLFLYTVGFATYFLFQVFVNIGMNMGIVPVVGIALPFISYGGSALVTLAIGLALLP